MPSISQSSSPSVVPRRKRLGVDDDQGLDPGPPLRARVTGRGSRRRPLEGEPEMAPSVRTDAGDEAEEGIEPVGLEGGPVVGPGGLPALLGLGFEPGGHVGPSAPRHRRTRPVPRHRGTGASGSGAVRARWARRAASVSLLRAAAPQAERRCRSALGVSRPGFGPGPRGSWALPGAAASAVADHLELGARRARPRGGPWSRPASTRGPLGRGSTGPWRPQEKPRRAHPSQSAAEAWPSLVWAPVSATLGA